MNRPTLSPLSIQRLSAPTAEQRTRIVDVLVHAFVADPFLRWIFPAPADFERHFPTLLIAYAGRAFTHGTADVASNDRGAALWLPPGVGSDETAVGELLNTVLPPERTGPVFDVFEHMSAFHPTAAHWYLPVIGVAPSQQGRGIGAALLRDALAHCDRAQAVAYLESTNPRNLPLYLRHGFRVLGEIQIHDAPPIIPMRRDPLPPDK